MTSQNISVTVDQVEFSWDVDKGLMLVWGQPVAVMWIESTLAGFMSGLQRMVGTERFNLAMEGAGRESTEAEWRDIIMRMPSFEEGLRFIGRCMRAVGLGDVELLELDQTAKRMRFRTRHSWEGIYQRALGVNWGTWSLAGKLVGYAERVFGVPCQIQQTNFSAEGNEFDEFEVTQATETYPERLAATLDTEVATREDLKEALKRLRDEVHERQKIEARLREENAERQRVELELRNKLAVIERQERALHALSTPILQVSPGVIAMPIIGSIDVERVSRMTEDLLSRITQIHAKFVILDLTGADILDEAALGSLLRVVTAVRLLGADCLLSGISPRMATAIVASGKELRSVGAFSTLETALAEASRRLRQGQ